MTDGFRIDPFPVGEGILLLDARAGEAALYVQACEVARLNMREAGEVPPDLAEEGIPHGLPVVAASHLAELCGRDQIPLAGLVVNDPAARYVPGLEHLPLHRTEFSINGNKTDAVAVVAAARAAFKSFSRLPNRPLHVLHLFHGDGGGPFALFLDTVPYLAATRIASSSIAQKESDVAHELPAALASRFLHSGDLDGGEPSFDGFVNLRRYEEAALEAAARIHATRRVDLVHVHTHAALAARAMHHLLGIPYLVTQHVIEREMERHSGRLEERYVYHTPELREALRDGFRAERDNVSGAAFVVGPSRASCAEIVRRFPLSQERVVHVPNGIGEGDKTETPLAAHLARTAGGRRIVSFVGALTRVKGADRFFAAAAAVLRLRPEVEVFVAGAPWAGHEDHTRWLAAVGETRDRIHLLGRITRAETHDLLAASEIVLCPSRYETFGLVALEALAAGAVPVVSDTGGLSELVGGTGAGVVVGSETAEAFAAAVLDLLDRDLSPLRACGRARAAQFPVAHTAARLAALYARICRCAAS